METPSGLTDFAKILGNRIRMRREELRMPQIDLGTLAQCSQARISEYESGTRVIPRPVFERLAKALGRTVDSLCEGIHDHVTMSEAERDAFCLRLVRKASGNTFAQAYLMLALGCIDGAKPASSEIAMRDVLKRGKEFGIAEDSLVPILEFIKSKL